MPAGRSAAIAELITLGTPVVSSVYPAPPDVVFNGASSRLSWVPWKVCVAPNRLARSSRLSLTSTAMIGGGAGDGRGHHGTQADSAGAEDDHIGPGRDR